MELSTVIDGRQNLEDLIGVPLFKVDTIVLGYRNTYMRKHHTTDLWTKIRQYGDQFPQHQVDTVKYPRGGFSFPDLARHYKGNIIWVSMFAIGNQDFHKGVVKQMETITNNTGRTNLHAINGRHHVNEMGGIECSSNNHSVIASCNTDLSINQNAHRCMGYLGGEPDVLAYDVVEALWKIFGSAED